MQQWAWDGVGAGVQHEDGHPPPAGTRYRILLNVLPVPIFEAATGIFFFKSSTSKSSMFTLKLLTNNRWKFIFFSFQFIFVILDIPFVSFVTTYYALIDRKGNMTGKHVCPPYRNYAKTTKWVRSQYFWISGKPT